VENTGGEVGVFRHSGGIESAAEPRTMRVDGLDSEGDAGGKYNSWSHGGVLGHDGETVVTDRQTAEPHTGRDEATPSGDVEPFRPAA